MFHRTERLLLRPAWPEDWEQVYHGVADEAVVTNLSRVPWPYHPADARNFVARPQDQDFPSFLVTVASSGAVVGCASLIARGAKVEIGYWIARRDWGRGYATEAARGIVEVARLLRFSRLSGRHFVDNPASGRVLTKTGFRPTGVVSNLSSLARGRTAPAVEYMLEIDDQAAEPQKQAA